MEGDQSQLPHASPQVNTKRTRRRNLKNTELMVTNEPEQLEAGSCGSVATPLIMSRALAPSLVSYAVLA